MAAERRPMEEHLTRRQRKALRCIGRFIEANGYPPTFRELARQMGGSSSSHGEHYVRTLERKGYLEHAEGKARGIRLAPRR